MSVKIRDCSISAESLAKLKELKIDVIKAEHDDDIIVSDGNCQLILGNPATVSTGGLGPCLGIMIVSKEPAAKLVFHFPSVIENYKDELENFFKAIDVLGIKKGKADIAVAGLSCGDPDKSKIYNEFRNQLMTRISDLKFSRTFRQWATPSVGKSIDYDDRSRSLKITENIYISGTDWDSFEFSGDRDE